MSDRKYLAVWGPLERFCLSYEPALIFQWVPSFYRFQCNGWHLYLWKFRLTRSSTKCCESAAHRLAELGEPRAPE